MEKIDNIVVVKVGTATLTGEDGRLDQDSFNRIGSQISDLRDKGSHVAIVSSAAISAGISEVKAQSRAERNYSVTDLRRFASIGWRIVMNEWARSLNGLAVGELLLTHRELQRRNERNEALAVTHCHFMNGSIVLANENDSISHEEITFGDNDKLAARFASKMGRSAMFQGDIKLVILSDIDGVYSDIEDRTSVISEIGNLTDYAHLATSSGTHHGTGGMKSKFDAADIAMAQGIDTWIANGRETNAIRRAINGEIGTHISSGINGQLVYTAAAYSEMI